MENDPARFLIFVREPYAGDPAGVIGRIRIIDREAGEVADVPLDVAKLALLVEQGAGLLGGAARANWRKA
jgi:hypothetical protein